MDTLRIDISYRPLRVGWAVAAATLIRCDEFVVSAPSNADRAHIEARSEHARGIGRAECLQIELLWSLFGVLSKILLFPL